MHWSQWNTLLIFAGAGLVPSIFMAGLHKKVLLSGWIARVVQWLFLLLAVSGIIVGAHFKFDAASRGVAVALVSPGFNLVAFRMLFRWFARVHDREPVALMESTDPRTAFDRTIAVVFALCCIFVSLLASGYLVKVWRQLATDWWLQ